MIGAAPPPAAVPGTADRVQSMLAQSQAIAAQAHNLVVDHAAQWLKDAVAHTAEMRHAADALLADDPTSNDARELVSVLTALEADVLALHDKYGQLLPDHVSETVKTAISTTTTHSTASRRGKRSRDEEVPPPPPAQRPLDRPPVAEPTYQTRRRARDLPTRNEPDRSDGSDDDGEDDTEMERYRAAARAARSLAPFPAPVRGALAHDPLGQLLLSKTGQFEYTGDERDGVRGATVRAAFGVHPRTRYLPWDQDLMDSIGVERWYNGKACKSCEALYSTDRKSVTNASELARVLQALQADVRALHDKYEAALPNRTTGAARATAGHPPTAADVAQDMDSVAGFPLERPMERPPIALPTAPVHVDGHDGNDGMGGGDSDNESASDDSDFAVNNLPNAPVARTPTPPNPLMQQPEPVRAALAQDRLGQFLLSPTCPYLVTGDRHDGILAVTVRQAIGLPRTGRFQPWDAALLESVGVVRRKHNRICRACKGMHFENHRCCDAWSATDGFDNAIRVFVVGLRHRDTAPSGGEDAAMVEE
ncbi:hypothetical protein GGF32_001188 [Allomyces javanicus]|nr:hypothetical protein GGF32_001188 [Allomyces javanicus]